MKLYKTITLSAPIRDVRLASADARVDIEARVREAEKAAYERGTRDAEKALSTQLIQQRAELLELQQGVFSSLSRSIPQVIAETEKAVIELAFEVAQKIVAGLPISAETIETTIQDALSQLEHKSDLTVQLNPEDLALLHKHNSPVLDSLPGADKLKLVSVPEVSRGGCVILTRFGVLDARRETKIEQLRKSLA
ncbi:MAG TPA: FliH/SctL family protein [Verrucomicrobiae bacterium]|nr:FliH/SctL family protein [Verrucomicrobiae bacterium]